MTIEPIELYDPPASFSVRWIVYIHLAGVVWLTSLSLAGTQRLISSEFSDWYVSSFLLSPLTGLLMLGVMFGCPLLMFLNLFKPSLTRKEKIVGVTAESLLSLANLFVLITITAH